MPDTRQRHEDVSAQHSMEGSRGGRDTLRAPGQCVFQAEEHGLEVPKDGPGGGLVSTEVEAGRQDRPQDDKVMNAPSAAVYPSGSQSQLHIGITQTQQISSKAWTSVFSF